MVSFSRTWRPLAAVLLPAAVLNAQAHFAGADTLRGRFSAAVATAQDSLPASPPPPVQQNPADVDAPIYYDAHFIDNDVDRRLTVLTGDAVVKYKNMTLEAGKITVDWNRHLLSAEALPESLVVADTVAAKLPSDQGQAMTVPANDRAERQSAGGLPVFSDGRDRMTGEGMEFNFETEKGRVTRGRTEFEDGRYSGSQIKRLNDDILNVSHGVFTTCDLVDEPHYHFSSRRMKILVNDKVLARPIVMYLGRIPLAALPFGVFPTRRGRHSGLIVPRFGQSVREGRYLRDLGYYWAASDYWDARLTLDYYDRSGWFARVGASYAWRYHFSGAVGGSLTRRSFAGGINERRWDIAVSHNQNLGETARLSASGYFVSDNSFYRDFSFNQDQRLTRRLRSQATFSKNWPEAKNNVSINVSEERDLEDGSVQRLLPQISFYYGQRQIFGGGPAAPQAMGSGRSQTGERRWYENFYFGFSSTASNTQTRTITTISPESTATVQDTRRMASHRFDLRLNSPQKYFGWLFLNQSANVNEDWFDRTTEFDQNDSTLAISSFVEKGFAARHVFSYSASANTKIYGTFTPRVAGIKALRHVVSPFVSFSYHPDFSEPRWGYYQEFVNAAGVRERRDRFGGTPRGKLAGVSMRVDNLFQMKTGPEGKEKKVDLFNLDFFASYNLAAKEFKLGDLNTSFRANPSRNVSVNMGATHSFYEYDQQQNRVVDRLLYHEHGLFSTNFLRLTSFRLDASLRLQGRTTVSPPASQQGGEDEGLQSGGEGVRNRFEADDVQGDGGIPWRANLSFSYNLSKVNPASSVKTIYLRVSNAEVQLTKNWRIGLNSQVDLRARQVVSQTYTFYRDLHCWEAQLRWTPTGPYRGFYFRINIKSPQLQEVKFEHRGGRPSIFGGIY